LKKSFLSVQEGKTSKEAQFAGTEKTGIVRKGKSTQKKRSSGEIPVRKKENLRKACGGGGGRGNTAGKGEQVLKGDEIRVKG